MTNKEIWKQMLSGEKYDASHPHLLEKLTVVKDLLWEYNALKPSETEHRQAILSKLLGHRGENCTIHSPFHCDYGENIRVGENFFANFNLTILDEAKVEIGDFCFIGPNVSMYTACHPLDADKRNRMVEWAEPIRIGHNVWIGGSSTILPGVTIGDNCVIGAGSVVTRDIPANSLAVGNPARVIRTIG